MLRDARRAILRTEERDDGDVWDGQMTAGFTAGTGKVAAQAITERASVSGTPENAYARLPPLQVAHGALAAYRAAVRRRDAGDASVPFRSWEEGGEPTVVLGAEDEARASVDSQPKHR